MSGILRTKSHCSFDETTGQAGADLVGRDDGHVIDKEKLK